MSSVTTFLPHFCKTMWTQYLLPTLLTWIEWFDFPRTEKEMCSFSSDFFFFFNLLVRYCSGFSLSGFGSVKMRMCVPASLSLTVMTVGVMLYPWLKKATRVKKKFISWIFSSFFFLWTFQAQPQFHFDTPNPRWSGPPPGYFVWICWANSRCSLRGLLDFTTDLETSKVV